MDIDIYENVFQNATFNPNVTYDLHPNYYVEIPMAAMALLSAIADVLIVIVAIKFPLMHTRLYYYITSWCICNFLFVSVPVTMNLMGFEGVISATALCIWTVIYFALMLGNLIFVAVILDTLLYLF
ncbi:hypothetical protein NQ318_006910 [Aromia moschata]|uniref:G-protein coupled receptors family 1 profile domain-containing protein n=1 Tax=Aromia moschata TaxID=1265417 RepID=A0AAV8X276_9CUCU|nr:hypothetical protein NQ318_006910 [Aromia moschata]